MAGRSKRTEPPSISPQRFQTRPATSPCSSRPDPPVRLLEPVLVERRNLLAFERRARHRSALPEDELVRQAVVDEEAASPQVGRDPEGWRLDRHHLRLLVLPGVDAVERNGAEG